MRIRINDAISYIECTPEPLSADIGIIRRDKGIWLYDVGGDPRAVAELTGSYHVVLSHFHRDHVENLGKLHVRELYVSGETRRHVNGGTVVEEELAVDGLRIFRLPSSHAKGCLGLEVDGEYAFVGDGLYSKFRDGYYIFNAQLVKEEIEVLKNLTAPRLLVSHYKGLVRDRAEVIAELEELYAGRSKDNAEIMVKA